MTVETVTSICDGDTFRANIKGFHSLIGGRIGIRVAGVDTPEMHGKCKQEKALARQAKLSKSQFRRYVQLRLLSLGIQNVVSVLK